MSGIISGTSWKTTASSARPTRNRTNRSRRRMGRACPQRVPLIVLLPRSRKMTFPVQGDGRPVPAYRWKGDTMVQPRPDRRSRLLRVAFLGMAAAFLVVPPAPAADPAGPDTSLKLVPGDAAFYSAMLRNREQLELVFKSRAWARLTSLPAVQTAWQMAMTQLDQPDGP